jgi:hypothetical protein
MVEVVLFWELLEILLCQCKFANYFFMSKLVSQYVCLIIRFDTYLYTNANFLIIILLQGSKNLNEIHLFNRMIGCGYHQYTLLLIIKIMVADKERNLTDHVSSIKTHLLFSPKQKTKNSTSYNLQN